MKANETALINAALDYLRLCGFRVAYPKRGKQPGIIGTVWRQNTMSCKAPSGQYVSSGIPGVSDIIGCAPDGRFFAAEAKVGKNATTSAQRIFIDAVNSRGGAAFAFWSLEELRAELIAAGYRAVSLA